MPQDAAFERERKRVRAGVDHLPCAHSLRCDGRHEDGPARYIVLGVAMLFFGLLGSLGPPAGRDGKPTPEARNSGPPENAGKRRKAPGSAGKRRKPP
eukprot:3374507-Alexandrium_andersonii.AAC.1